MRILALGLVCLLICAGSISAEEYKKEGEVLILTDSNIEQAIKDHPFIFIEFYAKWCGHCQELNPKWLNIAKRYKAANQPVVFAKIDADKNKKTGKMFKIQGFPTLILFINGQKYEYSDDNEEKNLDNFLKKLVLQPVTHKRSVMPEVTARDKVAVMVTDTPEGPVYELFQSVCRAHDHVECFSTPTSSELSELIKTEKSPSGIYVFKRKGTKVFGFQKQPEKEALDAFFHDHRFELIIQATDLDDLDQLFEKKAPPGLIGFFENENTPEAQAFISFANEIGHRGGLLFYMTHKITTNSLELGPLIGVSTLNRVALLKGNTSYEMKRYLLDKTITVENLRAFFSDYKEKKLPIYYRSEAAPSSQSGPLLKVTGDTLDKFYPNHDEYWAMFITEQECKKCDKYLAIYTKLAETYSSVAKFTWVDVGKNDLKGLEFSEVPSIIFFNKNTKVGAHFITKANYEALETFMKTSFKPLFDEAVQKTDL